MKHSEDLIELRNALDDVPEKSRLSIWKARMSILNLAIPLLEDYEDQIEKLTEQVNNEK